MMEFAANLLDGQGAPLELTGEHFQSRGQITNQLRQRRQRGLRCVHPPSLPPNEMVLLERNPTGDLGQDRRSITVRAPALEVHEPTE